jgi:hypothetical protein
MKILFLLAILSVFAFSSCATNSEKDDQGLKSPCIGSLIGSNY